VGINKGKILKELIKIILIMATLFTITFLIIKFTGILTMEQIEDLLNQAKDISPFYVGIIIATLLFADLFIAVPTLTIIILSGYFLGFVYGAVFSLSGVVLAGIVGYGLSRYYGDTILAYLIKDDYKRDEAISTFKKHGFIMILLSRAMPILPEVSACLSGMTKMSFKRFFLAWLMSAVPYVLIATYAGSISTLQNPKPAIFIAIGISSFFWITWFFYHKKHFKIIK